MSHKIAVVLAGCGVYDGSEVNEVVLTLLAIEEQEATYQCFAPDINQHHVINHINGKEENERRNVLTESGRIVRGNVKPLSELKENEFNALIVTGGFGVAKNLSDFATSDRYLTINHEFKNVMIAFKNARKNAGYMCIAPVLLPEVYEKVHCTIGNDESTAKAINDMGGVHVNCKVDGIVFDESNKVITTPAYMLATNMLDAKAGIDKLVSKVISTINLKQ